MEEQGGTGTRKSREGHRGAGRGGKQGGAGRGSERQRGAGTVRDREQGDILERYFYKEYSTISSIIWL